MSQYRSFRAASRWTAVPRTHSFRFSNLTNRKGCLRKYRHHDRHGQSLSLTTQAVRRVRGSSDISPACHILQFGRHVRRCPTPTTTERLYCSAARILGRVDTSAKAVLGDHTGFTQPERTPTQVSFSLFPQHKKQKFCRFTHHGIHQSTMDSTSQLLEVSWLQPFQAHPTHRRGSCRDHRSSRRGSSSPEHSAAHHLELITAEEWPNSGGNVRTTDQRFRVLKSISAWIRLCG